MSGRFRATALSREGGKTPPFPWHREARDGEVWFFHETLKPELLRAAFTPPAGAQTAPLGRGGLHYEHPELGPVRIKDHRRGGLLGRALPHWGISEASIRRELEMEIAFTRGDVATQQTLAVRIGGGAPRARALQRFHPDEIPLALLRREGKLTARVEAAARALAQRLAELRLIHRDFHGGNLLWHEARRSLRVIDLASARRLPARANAAAALAAMMERFAKPPRGYR